MTAAHVRHYTHKLTRRFSTSPEPYDEAETGNWSWCPSCLSLLQSQQVAFYVPFCLSIKFSIRTIAVRTEPVDVRHLALLEACHTFFDTRIYTQCDIEQGNCTSEAVEAVCLSFGADPSRHGTGNCAKRVRDVLEKENLRLRAVRIQDPRSGWLHIPAVASNPKHADVVHGHHICLCFE